MCILYLRMLVLHACTLFQYFPEWDSNAATLLHSSCMLALKCVHFSLQNSNQVGTWCLGLHTAAVMCLDFAHFQGKRIYCVCDFEVVTTNDGMLTWHMYVLPPLCVYVCMCVCICVCVCVCTCLWFLLKNMTIISHLCTHITAITITINTTTVNTILLFVMQSDLY